MLKLALKLPEDLEEDRWRGEWGTAERLIARHFGLAGRTDPWVQDAVRMTWRAKLQYSIETTLLGELRADGDDQARRHGHAPQKDHVPTSAPAGAASDGGSAG